MANQNWSRFPKTYTVASRLGDGRKMATLQELETVIEKVLDGKLGDLDGNSSTDPDTPKLLNIILDRDMPARSLDPQSETGIHKLFENKTRLKTIMDSFHEENRKTGLEIGAKAAVAVEKFYVDYLWLEALLRSGVSVSEKIAEKALINTSQHFSVAYYFLARKNKLNRPKAPGLAPGNALKALLASDPASLPPLSLEELVERIIQRTEDEPTRSSLSHDYARPFYHIPFGAYPSAALKVLGDVFHDPWIAVNTWAAAHGGWAYHDEIERTAEDAIKDYRRAA
ncbi:hypothetical protein N825_13790 [Skermanella stibiiresistens SB22]|uniref:Uncharacterized protein n=1 Tax=Skermanella stibiiresistens SB22 TaxID=1385369 RepID=W9GWJ8_9PROT|nr:hypothetical protein [Skermanella stibiiresistens]EWY38275.1 hypothetical protein N825_13790 [Skermanella stibiiresistens SB22]